MIRLALLVYLLFAWILAVPYYSGDVKNHLVWGESILNFGPYGFYERNFHDFAFPNYPPLAMWSFTASLKLYQLTTSLVWFLNTNLPIFPSGLVPFLEWENSKIAFLKLPAILATIGVAYAAYLLYKLYNPAVKKRQALGIMSWILFNPAIVYLSIIWGQIDLLPLVFLLFGLFFLFKRKVILSIILASLSLLSKQTVLVFWVIYMILIFRQHGLRTTLGALFLTTLIFYLAYWPFHEFSLGWPVNLYRTNFSLVAESTSENAINLWGYLFNFQGHPDTTIFWGLSLQVWGFFLFGVSILALLIFYLKSQKDNLYRLLSFLFLVSTSLFFFLTRMHERYLVPALVFATLLMLIKRRLLLILLFFTLLHFFNLYRGLLQPDLGFINLLISSNLFLSFLAGGYFLILAVTFYWFVRGGD